MSASISLSSKTEPPNGLLVFPAHYPHTYRARVLAAGTLTLGLLVTSACSSNSSSNPASTSAKSSSVSPSASASESADASGITDSAPKTREQLPAEATDAPDEFDDQSRTYRFAYIMLYKNKYPGSVQLTTDAPEYDSAISGYTLQVNFVVHSGHDIILDTEWTMVINGAVVKSGPYPLTPK
ncbi:MAG: hypothetical protein ABI206_09895, partial [Antricoccus sp.]